MLSIRGPQLEALQLAREREFVEAHLPLVRSRLGRPLGREGDRELAAAMSQAVARARAYALRADREILAYVLLALRVSPRFDEFPPIQRILTDPDLSSSQRLERLLDGVDPDDWQRAAAAQDRY